MQYFIRYDPRTGDIVGHLSASRQDISPVPRSAAEEILEVTSDDDKKALEGFDPASSRLKGRVHAGVLQSLKTEPIFTGRIALTSDHPDRDGDGWPELPADGTSVARIKATVVGPDGKPIKEKTRIAFKVTRGTLSARAVDAKDGAAEVEWRSPTETVRARIIAHAEHFQEASLTLEFIPPDEFGKLSSRKSK